MSPTIMFNLFRTKEPDVPPLVTKWGDLRDKKRWPEAIFEKGHFSESVFCSFHNVKSYSLYITSVVQSLEEGPIPPRPQTKRLMVIDFFTIDHAIRLDTPYTNLLIDQTNILHRYVNQSPQDNKTKLTNLHLSPIVKEASALLDLFSTLALNRST